MSTNKMRTHGNGVQHVVDYLKRMQATDPGFFYAIQDESEQTGGNIFWADMTSRMNYTYFGDAVIFDTTYRIERYKVPFAAFTGINHHGQPLLFGCALVFDESEPSFSWLFQTWLHAVSGRHPVSLTTEPERMIQVAAAQVLPHTRLRFSKWIILRKTQEKLAHVYQMHPTFENEFKKCVNDSETIHEFETSWESLVGRYYIMDNEWLQSMYNARQQWVPVYMRNTFFGEVSANEGSGVLNSFFQGFVNASSTMQILIKQYEKAIASWHEKELRADYDTTNSMPVLRTPSPMEKQAASFYTRRIFMKFQEELVETLANSATKIDESGPVTTYLVAKFGEDHRGHNVSFNSLEMKADCSCQMFDYLGIICRHILAVFRAKNVLTLPSQYVLQRWRRDAKAGVASIEQTELPNNTRESLTVRYNNLRQEAIKFVEEGAKSIQIYHVAMDGLKEASRKIAAAKNQNSGDPSGCALANGGFVREVLGTEENVTAGRQSMAEKERKIHELTEELEKTSQRCEVYRTNLLSILREMEEQKLELTVKVQSARLGMKE